MRVFRKVPLVLVTALLLAFSLLAGCETDGSSSSEIKPPAWEVDKAYELVLLHTNDHHGRVLPVDGLAGLAERATFVKSVREAETNVLLVDAGDINTGTALSNMFAAEIDIKAYNLMGYDAVTFGNHEFDGDRAKLDAQIELAAFPFVSSNIQTSNGGFLGGNQYLVKNYDGFRVGIIGITTLRTEQISNFSNMNLSFVPEISAAESAVNLLRNKEKAGVVIALTHIGSVEETTTHVTSQKLAAAVTGIDIIIDGHSHSKYTVPTKEGNTWIVSANEWGKYVGQGSLTIVNGEVTGFSWADTAIDNTYTADTAMMALLQPYIDQAEESLKEVVGVAADDFDFGNRWTRYQETAIGNMITDANYWYVTEVLNQDIDFVFHNGGNIRANLTQGELTREDILTVLPFENILYIVSFKGDKILELFDFIATVPQGNGGFPQFSEQVRYTLDVPGETITDLTIGGAPVDPDKIYRFCTNEYLLGGGDEYNVLTEATDPYNTSLLLSTAVIEYIEKEGTITPAKDGRMVIVDGIINP